MTLAEAVKIKASFKKESFLVLTNVIDFFFNQFTNQNHDSKDSKDSTFTFFRDRYQIRNLTKFI